MSSTLLQVTRSHSLGDLINLRMARHITEMPGEHQVSRQHAPSPTRTHSSCCASMPSGPPT